VATQEEGKPSRLTRLREQHYWLDRLLRAVTRYQAQYGDYYAAAITYFSVLALVPLLMIAFAIAGFVLRGNPDLLERLQTSITTSVPNPAMSQILERVVNEAVNKAGAVGLLGLLGALYSGLGWMTNLREALSAQWTQKPEQPPMIKRMAYDLAALGGLGAALVLSFGISAFGGFGRRMFELLGIADTLGAAIVLRVLAIALSLAASWLVFLWVLTRLPRQPVAWRDSLTGALFAAVGFELLKQVGQIYLNSVTSSPAGAAFGPIIGLLVFANLASRFILFTAAWTAVGQAAERRGAAPQPPGPAILRPVVVQPRMRVATSMGLFGLGALASWLWRRFR
jgi:membrane protein